MKLQMLKIGIGGKLRIYLNGMLFCYEYFNNQTVNKDFVFIPPAFQFSQL